MSKGHGRVERAILEALKQGKRANERGLFFAGAKVNDLARYVRYAPALKVTPQHEDHRPLPPDAELKAAFLHHRPTRSELEAVRRALRNLCKQGLVREIGHRKPHIYCCADRIRSLTAGPVGQARGCNPR
jgi:hypothetical protein